MRYEVGKNVSRFDKIFKPWKKWQDIKLTNMCPCKECETYIEYEMKALYGNIAERQYAELPDGCRICIDRINWEMDCMAKLNWYEDHDDTLKE